MPPMPAARVLDMHICPMVTPAVVPIPHVGGPILPPGGIPVLIGGMPAARVGDLCICVGPPDVIVMGEFTVLIGGRPAARMLDMTAHGGMIVLGCFTVLIGGTGGAPSGSASGAVSGPAVAPAPAAPAPAAPALAAPAPPTTGLGKDVDNLASKSPTLTKNLEQLQKDGWTVKYGTAGKGTFADRSKKEIAVDPNDKGSPAKVVQFLAHESGHARYTKDPYVDLKGKTKDEYVKANVKSDLKDEGEATLTNIQVRDEIVKNGGQDIGIAGTQTKKYEEIAKKYPDAKDRDKGREEIGEAYAKGEHPSTDPKSTYEDYYAKTYQEHYDKNVPPAKKP